METGIESIQAKRTATSVFAEMLPLSHLHGTGGGFSPLFSIFVSVVVVVVPPGVVVVFSCLIDAVSEQPGKLKAASPRTSDRARVNVFMLILIQLGLCPLGKTCGRRALPKEMLEGAQTHDEFEFNRTVVWRIANVVPLCLCVG